MLGAASIMIFEQNIKVPSIAKMQSSSAERRPLYLFLLCAGEFIMLAVGNIS